MTDIGQDVLMVRGYDERGVLLWGPQVWQDPTPVCFDMPLTVQQVLLERFRGDVLVSADLLELWDHSTEYADATVTYTIPSGASTSMQVADGAVYYVLDVNWFPPNPPRTTSLDGRPVGREIQAQSVLSRLEANGKEWTLLLNSPSIEPSLLPAPGGGIYLKFSLNDYSDPTLYLCQVDADGTVLWRSTLPDGYAMGVKNDGTLWVMSYECYYPLASNQQAVPNALGSLARALPRSVGVRLQHSTGCDDGERQPRTGSAFLLPFFQQDGVEYGPEGL